MTLKSTTKSAALEGDTAATGGSGGTGGGTSGTIGGNATASSTLKGMESVTVRSCRDRGQRRRHHTDGTGNGAGGIGRGERLGGESGGPATAIAITQSGNGGDATGFGNGTDGTGVTGTTARATGADATAKRMLTGASAARDRGAPSGRGRAARPAARWRRPPLERAAQPRR